MDFDEYRKTVRTHFNTYFRRIYSGVVPVEGEGLLYPSEIIFGNFGSLYSFELVGSMPDFDELRDSRTRATDINSYVGQYEAYEPASTTTPLFDSTGWGDGGVSFLTFATQASLRALKLRYPKLELLDFEGRSVILRADNSDEPIIRIGECLGVYFEDVYLVNGTLRGAARLKHIVLMYVHNAARSRRDVKRTLLARYPFDGPEFRGLCRMQTGRDAEVRAASQLIGRVLTPGTAELDLSGFLRDHADVLKKTFGYTKILYEPYLEWQPGLTNDGATAYNPDFMARRTDGYWDFIELKLPLRTVRRVTRGKGAHLRFTSDVYEAISQSAHYADYFSYPANREYAKNRYGIRVREPRRIIIAGTSENSNPQQVARALRTAPSDTEVFDYDTLINLYLTNFA